MMLMDSFFLLVGVAIFLILLALAAYICWFFVRVR